jgi:hypothetical protein
VANRRWLEDVRERLVENTLPPEYVRRLMEELTDHFQDLKEETMSKDAEVLSRLGEADHVAEAAVLAYKRRHFLGRHPTAAVLAFAVLPAVSMLVSVVLAAFCVMVFSDICGQYGLNLADRDHLGAWNPLTLNWGLSLLTVIGPSVLLTVVYCWIAKRAGMKKKWMLLACGAVSVVAMLLLQGLALSDVPGNSQWTIGLSVPPSSLMQCVQLLVPFAIGLWLTRRTSSHRPADERMHLAAQ